MDVATRRANILGFIADFHAAHGYYPTVREIGAAVGLASTSSTHRHLLDLMDEGRVVRLQVTSDRFVFALPGAS